MRWPPCCIWTTRGKTGEWEPNRYGGRENLEAIDFLRELNTLTHGRHPGTLTIAEESTAWPQVTRPTWVGGLGFSMKWNMGWMHDTLNYMSQEPIYRQYHHDQLTFGLMYAFSENFLLPFSHDEVVHGKGSMLGKMPGDEWQRFANLRLLYTICLPTRGPNCCSWAASWPSLANGGTRDSCPGNCWSMRRTVVCSSWWVI